MQRRVKTEVEFNPTSRGNGPITEFSLVKTTVNQCRRSDRETWLNDTDQPDWYQRETLVEGLSRQDVQSLVNDAVDWLTYIETEEG